MKLFSCDNCEQTLYFENNRCVSCGQAVGYSPDLARLATLGEPDESGIYEVSSGNDRLRYRLCRNAREHDACNWLVAADENAEFCRSCALSEVIPDLSDRRE